MFFLGQTDNDLTHGSINFCHVKTGVYHSLTSAQFLFLRRQLETTKQSDLSTRDTACHPVVFIDHKCQYACMHACMCAATHFPVLKGN